MQLFQSNNNNNNNTDGVERIAAAAVGGSGSSSSSCPICLDLLRFPVSLPCGHSVCKPCILSLNKEQASRIAFRCPTCLDEVAVDDETELRINVALQSAVEILKGDQVPNLPCMRCEAVEATVDCPECNGKFCSSCSDLVHVGKFKAHRITYSADAVQAVHKPPYCTQVGHEDYRTDLFCVDCKAMLCVVCSQVSPLHRSHVVVPLSEAADVEKGKLRQTLQSAGKFRTELKKALQLVDEAVDRNEQHVALEVAAFDRSLGQLIHKLQEKRASLIEHAKLMNEAEMRKLRRVRGQIVDLASALNDTVASSQRALVMGTNTAIIKGCVDMEIQLARTEPVLIPDTYVPVFHSQPSATQIHNATEALSVALSSDTNIDAQVVEAGHIFQRRGFQFNKSTYNDLTMTNRGQSVASKPGTSWETAMGSELFSSGVVYYEVSVQQYTPVNGHNIIVGVVFDGAFELCEVIGEDVQSVGFDLGRGTKCVGGDYFLPYATDAVCGQGDVIGVKIDFDQHALTFYRNGRSLGVAFTGLTKPCYAAVSLCDAQKVSLMFPMKTPL